MSDQRRLTPDDERMMDEALRKSVTFVDDAPPSALLLGLADDLAARVTLGQGLNAGEVATLARRIRDYAKDVDATEKYAAKLRQQIDGATWWSDGDE